MESVLKNQWKWIAVVLIFCSGVFVYYNQDFFSNKLSALFLAIRPETQASPSANIVQKKSKFPVRLRISAIGVDALVEQVGANPTGEMDTPRNYSNVAWFNLGPSPGAEGSAVIAGHLDYKNGQKAVFYDLNKLKMGDQLFIEDEKGKFIVFIVREMRSYDSHNLVPEVFLSSEGQHLNLITCAGAWDHSKKEYAERLVVFTDRE